LRKKWANRNLGFGWPSSCRNAAGLFVDNRDLERMPMRAERPDEMMKLDAFFWLHANLGLRRPTSRYSVGATGTAGSG
jgi:hypothetical protein